MWLLFLYIALAPGQSMHRVNLNLPSFATLKDCEAEKVLVWADMDASYPVEERKLYRFTCELMEAYDARIKTQGTS